MCVNLPCYVATKNPHCCLHDGIRFPHTTCCVYVFYRTVTNNCIVIVFAANEEYYQLLMINDSQPSGLDVSSYTIEEIDSITSEYTLKNNVSCFEIVQTFYFLCIFFVAVYTEERRCSPAFTQLSNVWSDLLDSLGFPHSSHIVDFVSSAGHFCSSGVSHHGKDCLHLRSGCLHPQLQKRCVQEHQVCGVLDAAGR